MTNAPSPRKYHRWTVGDRLAVARKTITSSQIEFAELTGIGQATVSRYETAPDAFRRKNSFLRIWSNATGFDIDWLLTGIEPNEGPDDDGGVVIAIKARQRAENMGSDLGQSQFTWSIDRGEQAA